MHPGIYRGTVEDVNDPERRKRMRVRVHNIHPPEVPTENLPWSELALFGSKFVGDIPSYEPNDIVFVAFEGGDKAYPVVMGGYFAFAGGVPDVPTEVEAEYERTQKRWVRIDRANNKIVMSPLPEERWIQIEAGDARMFLRQNDGTIELIAGGTVRVISPVIELNAEEQPPPNGGGELTSVCKTSFAEVTGSGAVKCGSEYAIRAASRVRIGAYTNDLLLPFATDEVEIDANNNIIVNSRGTIDIDALQDITVDTPTDILATADSRVIITGTSTVEIHSDGDVLVQAGGKAIVDATGNVEVKSAQAVIIQADGSTVDITSTTNTTITVGANATIDVTGNCTLDVTGNLDLKSIGAMTLDATAGLTLKSAVRVTMEAPICEVKGTAQAVLDGGALTQITGALVTIG